MTGLSESAVSALFVGFVATVLGAYAWELIALVRRRFGRSPPSPVSAARRWWRRGVLAAGTAGTLCIVYGFAVEPTWIETVRVRVPLERLPRGSAPVVIVQISDLHVEDTPRNEVGLAARIAPLRPDLIVFTGDSVNHPAGVERFLTCLRELAALAPLYAVEGNWDVYSLGGARPLERSAARVLRGDVLALEVRGTRLVLAGIAYGEDATIPSLGLRQHGDAPVVVLTHAPDPVLELADAGADLVLAGHTHGGQVRLPGYGALLTLARHGKRFEAGLYRVGATWLYVNRGLGMEGGLAPRVRFLTRPEITVLELVPAEER